MGWLTNIFGGKSRRDAKADAARKVRRLYRAALPRMIEPLEDRTLLSVSFPSSVPILTFTSTDTHAAQQETDLSNLFSSGGDGATATFNGNVAAIVSGESVNADFTVTKHVDSHSNTSYTLAASGLSAKIAGGLVEIDNAGGNLSFSTSGISGSVTASVSGGTGNITATNLPVSAAGTLSLAWDTTAGDKNLMVSVTGATFTVGSNSFGGDLTFEKSSSSAVAVTAANVNLSFATSGGTSLVSVSGGAGSLNLDDNGVFGVADVGSITVPHFSASGHIYVEVNTTGQSETVTDPQNSARTVTIPAGPAVAAGIVGGKITVGTVDIPGDYIFTASSNTTPSVTVSVSNINETIGNVSVISATIPPPISATSWNIVDGPVTYAVNATGAELAVTASGDSSFSLSSGQAGGVTSDLNSGKVDSSLVSIFSSQSITLSTGSKVTQEGTSSNQWLVAANSDGGGNQYLLTTNGGGGIDVQQIRLVLDPAVFTGSLNNGNITQAMTDAFHQAGITLFNSGGSFTIGTTGISGTVTAGAALTAGNTGTLSGQMGVVIDSSGGVEITGTGIQLNAFGQTLTGDFTVQASDSTKSLQIANASFNFGGGLVSATGVSGNLTVSSSTVTGNLSGSFAANIGGVAFSGDAAVDFQPGTITLSGTNDTLTFGDQTLTGSFTFTKTSGGVSLSVPSAKASLFGGLVTLSGSIPVATPLTISSTGAVSGSFTGTVGLGTGLSGIGFTASATVTVGNGTIKADTDPANPATVTAAGHTFSAGLHFFEDAQGFELGVDGINLALIGGAVSLKNAAGTLKITKSANTLSLSGTATGTVSAGDGTLSGDLSATFGNGTVSISGTSDQLIVLDEKILGDFTFTEVSSPLSITVAVANLQATLDNGLLTVANGSASLTFNSSGLQSATASGTISAGNTLTGIAFNGPLTVTFAPGSVTAGTPDGQTDTFTVGSQTFTASFTISDDSTNGFVFSISGVNLTLGGGAISVQDAGGTLSLSPSGTSGSVSGTLVSKIVGFSGQLSVTFDTNGVTVSGQNDLLSAADQFVKGDFTFVVDQIDNTISLTIANGMANLFNGLVTVSAVAGQLSVDSDGNVTGSVIGNLNVGTVSGVQLSGPIGISVGLGSISAGTPTTAPYDADTTDTLVIVGQTINAALSFTEDAQGFELGISRLSLAVGNVVSVQNASGTIKVDSTGLSGSISGNLSSSIAGLSGGLSVTFGPGGITIAGSNATLAIGDQSVSGNFSFSKDNNTGIVTASIDSGKASLLGGLVSVTDASGSLSIDAQGKAIGFVNGTVSGGSTLTGVSFSGPITVNVTPTSISGGTPTTPAGTVDTLTVGGTTLSAALQFVEDPVYGFELSISGVKFNIANGLVNVTDGSGTVNIAKTGITGTFNVTFTSTVAGLGGSLALTFGNGSFSVTGKNDTLAIGDQSLSGDFAFSTTKNGPTTLSISNASASLFGGLVSITGASATLLVDATGQVSGSFSGTVSAGTGLSGISFTGPITVTVAPGKITAGTPPGQTDSLTVAGQTVSGNLSFHEESGVFDLTISNVNISLGGGAVTVTNAGGTLTVAPIGATGSLTGTLSANVPGNATFGGTFTVNIAPGSLTIGGNPVSLTLFGQTLSGNFTFATSNGVTTLHIDSLTGSFAGGAVTLGSGTADLTISSSGITGTASGNLATTAPNITFGGQFTVTLSPTAFSVAGTNVTLSVFGQGATGNLSLSFDSPSHTTTITASNLNISLGGFVAVTNAGGTITLTPTGTSGSVSGTIQTNVPGATFGGTLQATFGATGITVSGTSDTLTILGQTVQGDFSFTKAPNNISLAISNFGLSIGGIVTVDSGAANLTIDSTGTSGSGSGHITISGVSGVTVAGAFSIAFDATGVHVSGKSDTLTIGTQSITGDFTFSKTAAGVDLQISNLALSLGGVVNVTKGSGDFTVTSGANGGVAGTASGTVAINVPNVTFGGTFTVTLDATGVHVTGTGVTVQVAGQTIGGDFTFAKTGSTTSLHVENLNLSFGGIVTVSNGTADFTITTGTGGGLTGGGSGDVSIANLGANIQFSGSFSFAVAPDSVTVSGTNDTLTIFGQTLSGNFSFTNANNVTKLNISALNLSLGGGLVTVTGGAASFTVASTGITGTASGTLGLGNASTGVSFSGNVTLTLTTTGVTVTGTNDKLTIAGQTLTANLSFAENSTTGAINITVSNLTLSFSGANVVFSGTLQLGGSGLSGSLTGSTNSGGVSATVTATFANGTFTLAAGVSTNLDLGGLKLTGTFTYGAGNTLTISNLLLDVGNGLVKISGGSANFTIDSSNKLNGTATGTVSLGSTVNGISLGGQVTLTITASTVVISGINDTIGVFGQTLSGNFTIIDNQNGTVEIKVDSLNISLANVVSLTNGAIDLTLSSAGVKGVGGGAIAFTLPGVGFGGNFAVAVDTTGGNQNVQIAGTGVTLTVGPESLQGNFLFQKTTINNVSTVAILIDGVNATLGDGTAGAQISGGHGALLVVSGGVALDVGGNASLFGINNLQLVGSIDFRFSDVTTAINQTVTGPDPSNLAQQITQTLKFSASEQDVAGTLTLSVLDSSGNPFVALQGGFAVSISKGTPDANHIQTSKIIFAAAGVSLFVGAGGTGVKVSSANLGIVVFSRADVTNPASPIAKGSTYAISASGQASLVNVNNLQLSGTLSLSVNNTGGAVNETVNVPDPVNAGQTIPVAVQFDDDAFAFSGSLTLAVTDSSNNPFVSLSGGFSFAQQPDPKGGTDILVAVAGVTAFFGSGGVGLQIQNGTLGLEIVQPTTGASSFAFEASGGVALVGLPGLNVSGTFDVQYNTTPGEAKLSTTVPDPANPGQTLPVSFDLAAGAFSASGTVSFSILDGSGNPVVSISGAVSLTRTADLTTLDIQSVTVAIFINNSPAISVTGEVKFTIGSATSSNPGFNIVPGSAKLTDVNLLGEGDVAIPALTAGHDLTVGGGAASPAVSSPTKLGPLTLTGFKPDFSGFSFKNNTLNVTIGLHADSAQLSFGQNAGDTSSAGVTSTITGLDGSFGISVGVDTSSFRITHFGPTGKFSLSISTFSLTVQNVLNITANGVNVNYDPAADNMQKIVTIANASISLDKFNISGTLSQTTDSSGNPVPGLTIFGNGFQLGKGTVTYTGPPKTFGPVTLQGPSITVSNFGVTFGSTFSFSGSIGVAVQSIQIQGSALSASGTNVSATLQFTNNVPSGFIFTAGSLAINISSLLSLSATNVTIDPYATGSQDIASFSNVNATVTLSGFSITGSAGSTGGSFEITGDGQFIVPNNFSVGLSIGAGTSGALDWPSFIPIQITSLTVIWPSFHTDPTNFEIDLSASVQGTFGPITLSGSVQDVVFNVGLLEKGQFPITSIGAFTVSAMGDLFGGTIDGTLVMGVIRFDAAGNRIPDDAAHLNATVDHSVFYAGIEAGFSFEGLAGIQIRLGISQNGPLDVYLEADVPILLDPDTGLTINNLHGGITFNATPFPDINDPMQLRSPIFSPSAQLTPTQWLAQLQQEVVNQAGGSGGFLFSITDTAAVTDNTTGLGAGLVNNALVTDFTNASFTMPLTGKVTPEGANTWLVNDASDGTGNNYLITANKTGGLDVSKVATVLDPSTFTSVLNAGTVTSALVTAFQNAGLTLSTNATITKQPDGTWLIVDGPAKFVVSPAGSTLAVGGNAAGGMAAMNSVIKIEAGATLYSEYTSQDSFEAKVDLIFTTDGKFLINADALFGGDSGIDLNIKLFADLSKIKSGQGKILFLADLPKVIPPMTKPLATVFGKIQFQFLKPDGKTVDPNPVIGGPDSFQIIITGGVQVSLSVASFSETATLSGQVILTIDPLHKKFELNFNAGLSLDGVLTADNFAEAAGDFVIDFSGPTTIFYGAAKLTVDGDKIPGLSSAGITVAAVVLLQINTDADNSHELTLNFPDGTSEDFTVPKASFGFAIAGALNVNKGPITLSLAGTFVVQFNDNNGQFEFDLFILASLQFGISGAPPIFEFEALGALIIKNDAFAAELYLRRSVGTDGLTGAAPTDVPGLPNATLSVDFYLYINSTGVDQTITLPQDADFEAVLQKQNLPADLTARIHGGSVTIKGNVPENFDNNGNPTSYGAAEPYLVVGGNGTLTLGGFVLTGDITITATPDGLTLQGDLLLDLEPFGTLSASGYLQIGSAGVVASFQLQRNFGLSTLQISAAAALEVNSTSNSVTVLQYTYDPSTGTAGNTKVPVTIPAGSASDPYLEIDLAGKVELTTGFVIQGSFHFINSTDFLTFHADASLNAFFGLTLKVSGDVTIWKTDTASHTKGMVGSFTVDAGLGIPGAPGIFDLHGTLSLEVNTTHTDDAATGIKAGDVHVGFDGYVEVLSILHLDATVSVTYNLFSHAFELDVNTSITFLGFANITFDGWFRSDGTFHLHASGGINLDIIDTPRTGLDGTFNVDIDYNDPNGQTGQNTLRIDIGGGLTLKILGVTVAGGGIDASYDSGNGHIYVRGSVTILGITYHHTFDLGEFTTPPATIYLGGTASDSQVSPTDFPGGALYLNVGARATLRQDGSLGTDDTVNLYTTTLPDGSSGLAVDINGTRQVFKNVTQVVATGSIDTTFIIDDTVNVPVYLIGGSGTNEFDDSGTAGGTFIAGPGNSANTFHLGSGPITVYGGAGTDTVYAGTGNGTFIAGSGNETVIWDGNSSGNFTASAAGAGSMNVNVSANTKGNTLALSNSGGATQVAVTASAIARQLTITGSAAYAITATGGGDAITVNNIAGLGISSLTFDLGAAHQATDTLTVNGTTGNDKWTVDAVTLQPSGSTQPPAIDIPANAPSVQVATTDIWIGRPGVVAIQFINASAVTGDTLAVNGSGGNDSFYIPATIVGVTLQNVTTAGFTTTFNVGLHSTDITGTLGNISGPITVLGSNGTDILVADDTADFLNRTFSLASASVITSAAGANGAISYDAKVDSLDVRSGGGSDTFNIQTTIPTALEGGAGDDAFIIPGPLGAALNVVGGSILFAGNTLTVNGSSANQNFVVDSQNVTGDGAAIHYSGIQSLTVNGIGGNDTFKLNGASIPTTLQGGPGIDAFTVNSNSAATIIDGGDGNDSFTINANSASLSVTGHNGSNAFVVNGNSSSLTLNGGTGIDTFAINANSGAMTVNGGIKSNAFTISSNSGSLTLNSNGGTSGYAIGAISSPVTMNLGNSPATIHVGTPLLAGLTITGNATSFTQFITIDATAANNNFVLTGTSISGAGSAIGYNDLLGITVNGNGGLDAFTVNGTKAPVVLTGGLGNGTFNLQAMTSTVAITTGDGTSIVNLGSKAPQAGGILDNLRGGVTITGSGLDSLNLDDDASAAIKTGTLTENTISGFGLDAAGVTFSGIRTLNLALGSGGDRVLVVSTAPATTTNISAGSGSDLLSVQNTAGPLNINAGGGLNIFNVGSSAPAISGSLSGISGAVSYIGSGNDIINLDDTGDTSAATGTLTPASLSGLGAAGISFSGMANLNLSLGSGSNTLTIPNTPANANTTVTLGSGTNHVALQGTTGRITLLGHGGNDNITLGKPAVAGGSTLDSLQGGVTIIGNGNPALTDAVTLDDTATTTPRTGTISSTNVQGFGLGAQGVVYTGLSSLTVSLGSGGNAASILGTAINTTTTLNSGSGTDAITILGSASTLLVNSGAGNDTIDIRAVGGDTTINTGTGVNTILIGSSSPSVNGNLSGILGAIHIQGSGKDTLTLDDRANPLSRSGSLSDTAITGLGMTGGVTYAGLAAITLNLGFGNDGLTITATNAATPVTVNGNNGNDTVAVQSTASNVTINTAAGNDSVEIQGTGAGTLTTVNTGTGANSTTVGSLAPAAGGVLSNLLGAVSITGSGSDSLTLDDSGSTLARNGSLTASAFSGFGTAGISFSGIALLSVLLGSGGADLGILGTGAATTTSILGGGNGFIGVLATTGPLSITGKSSDAIAIGRLVGAIGGTLAAIKGAVSVNGDGSIGLSIDDSSDTAPRTVTIDAAKFTFPNIAPITYSNLGTFNVLLGPGGNTVSIPATPAAAITTINTGDGNDTVFLRSTAGPTTLSTGGGSNTTLVGSLSAATPGLLSGLAAKLTIMGAGSDFLMLDDSANAAASAGSLDAANITGLGTAGVSYSGVKNLTIKLGTANDTFTITSTNTKTTTTINGGAGNDTFQLVSNSGPTNINTGAGNDAVNVQASGGATSVNTGTGNDTITVGTAAPAIGGLLSNIKGALSVTGGGNTSLILDDSADTNPAKTVVTSIAVKSLAPATISYATIKTLTINLGSGADTVTVNSTAAGTTTNINAGGSDDSFTLAAPVPGLAAALAGPLNLDAGAGANTLLIDDGGDKTARTVAITATSITGIGQPIGYANFPALTVKLGSGNDTLSATNLNAASTILLDGGPGTDTANLGFTGDFSDILTLANFEHSSISVTGSFAGSLSAPTIDSATIGGAFTGSLSVAGKFSSLTLGAIDAGTITAGSVGTISATAAVPGASGMILSVRQAGILRQVLALAASGNPFTGLTFKYLYDGATGAEPQIAIRVTNSAPATNRFDLVLTSSLSLGKFDLSRLDGATTANQGVRNVTIEGNLLNAVTAVEKTFFAYASGTVGGINLPGDNLAAVAAQYDARTQTVIANTIQAVAFSTLTNSAGAVIRTAGNNGSGPEQILGNNAVARRLTQIVEPTEPLHVVFGDSAKVDLFFDDDNDTAKDQKLEDSDDKPIVFADQLKDNLSIAAIVTPKPVIGGVTVSVALLGDGGSIDATTQVTDITCTGPLGDLFLRSGKGIANVTAPSVFGNVDLFGGSVTGTFQTTGLRIDPATGAATSSGADLGRVLTSNAGAATGVTYFHGGVASTGRIISRGNLFAQITAPGILAGLIAAQGDIGAILRTATNQAILDKSGHLTRFGGISAAGSSTQTSTVNIVALGNIYGDLKFAGNFSGRLAAQGAAASGLAANRIGIFGNVTIANAITSTGAIISGGLIGDAAGATAFSAKSLAGFTASKGAVALAKGLTLPASRILQSQTGANAAAIDAIWTDGGISLSFDQTPGDLAGLSLILSDATALTLSGSTLAGTNP